MYLAAVMDVYNRQIIGWALPDRLNKALVVDSLSKALKPRSPQPGLIFHSDRGSQYASDKVKKILKAWHIRRSIFEYIEIFYNRQRRHSALNYKSPLEYYTDATQTF